MSEELDLLREIGAQKIYEDTHISLQHVQSMIHESFEDLTKVQFLGFLSILEREYHQDLSALKVKGLEYFENEPSPNPTDSSVFVEPKRTYKPTYLYIAIALVVFISVAYLTIASNSSQPTGAPIDNSTIESAQKNITTDTLELNVTDENVTEVVEEIIEEKVVPKEFKVITRSRLWIGYNNRTDDIKKQMIIKEFLDLDPSKEWLLSLGHGNVSFEINGELIEFNTRNIIRFLYKDGELKKLNLRDFKILNEGRVW